MSLKLEQFHFYDPAATTRRTRRDLPHWDQPGVCAFVTFRLLDSLPREIMAGWLTERAARLRDHGLDPDHENWRATLDVLPEETVTAFHRTFTRRMHDLLDAGHGACQLRQPPLRRIVEDALMHWHNRGCLLAGWVLMPNHVHVLVQPLPGHGLLDLCKSWKQWTARAINAASDRTGHLGQGESWDHLLRRPPYLVKFRNYLRLNPTKAHLPPEDYTLWLPEIEGLEE